MKAKTSKAKKMCAWLIACVLLISITGCGSEETNKPNTEVAKETTTGAANETVAVETTEAVASPKIVFEEIVVVDNDECTIKIKELDPDNMWGYTLKVYFENKSLDKTYMFSVYSASVNGIDSDPGFATEVAPGKKSNNEINFSEDILEELGIEFTDIEIAFRVSDSNDWIADPVALETINVYPYGEENATKYVREVQATDIVLVDNEYVTAIVTGFDPDGSWGYTANLYLVNKTDTSVMFSVDEASVNGYMLDPFWATTVLPGACKFKAMSWYESTLEENGITDVEEIEFIFNAYDYDDFDKNYVKDIVTLNPNK